MRAFDGGIEELALDWFQQPVQPLALVRTAPDSKTAHGACEVSLPCGRLAFVKPTLTDFDLIAANEKLAADLGYLLGLPVAPVAIVPPGSLPEFPDRHLALSLSCFSKGRAWGRAGPAVDARLAETLEALRVFWSWIGDVDHDAHYGNLRYAIDVQGGIQVVSIDHSLIGGGGWDDDPLTTRASSGYAAQSSPAAARGRQACLEAIAALDDAQVAGIVGRLVGVTLTGGQAGLIGRWLVDRKTVLAGLVNGDCDDAL